LPLKIDFLIGSGEGKKLRAIKALFYCPKTLQIIARKCTILHNFFDDKNGFQRQNWRGFGRFSKVHKKRHV
jgi:hypothetical protein